MEQESQVEDGFDQFPEDVAQDVDGLMWLGYLEDTFDFCGHTFTIRTLRGEEELLASYVTKEYMESLGQSRAWVWAQVALTLVSIDGDEDFCPPAGPSKKAYAQARFQYVTANWYWPTAKYIYDRYAALLERQAAAMDAVESLSREGRMFFTASPDSLIEKADLEDAGAEILSLLDDED